MPSGTPPPAERVKQPAQRVGLREIPETDPLPPRGSVDKRRLLERNVPGGLPKGVHALLRAADRASEMADQAALLIVFLVQ